MAEKKKMMESAAPAADKKKALETAMAQIEKTYGKGAIMRLGTNTRVVVESIPTGSVALDLALGIGGVPRGRIIEIYGPESSGKTTLALHIAAEAQKRGGEVAFIDAEHALDPTYARALGVDIDNMLISQPDTGEQGLEICEALVRSGALDVLVVDSVAALVDEPGPAEAGRFHFQDQLCGHLHQPAPGKGGGDVRQPRGHHRRPGLEILLLCADGGAPGGAH